MNSTGHIFLTGFMGSGKSSLGKSLGALAGLGFADLDSIICDRAGQSIPEIFASHGEAAFRKMETECLTELVASAKSALVVALGGGTVCSQTNLDLVKANSLLVYLDVPPAELMRRLENDAHERPLLAGAEGDALLARIENLLAERKKYYGQAHLTVNGLNLTAQQLYSNIVAFAKKNSS